MILPILASLLSTSASSAQWTKVNQPTATIFQNATILSDGKWIALDGSYNSWTSSDRGGTWSSFADANGSNYADILGNGIAVTWEENGGTEYYDVATSTWIASSFDRSLDGSWPDYALAEELGRYCYWFDRSDSALFFVSTDSARTWKVSAVLPESACPGGCAHYATFVSGMVWVTDTVQRRLRGTASGSSWLEIPFSAHMASETLMDTLPGGGWIAEMIDSDAVVHWKSTIDSGKTWQDYDASQAGAVVSSTGQISSGWQYTTGYLGDSAIIYVRPQSGGWTLLPDLPGDAWGDFFVDNGRIYGTGDSGLVSLDLGVLGVHGRSTGVTASATWRMEGSNLVVSNAASATGWELRDLSGRNLATGKSTGASELHIPAANRKGLLLVRLTGTAPQTFSVLAP